MNNARTTVKTAFGLGLIAFAASAMAGTAAAGDEAGWYIGGNAGAARARIGDGRIVGGLNANGFATTSIADDSRGLGYKVYGGYRFLPFLAVEGGYFDLG